MTGNALNIEDGPNAPVSPHTMRDDDTLMTLKEADAFMPMLLSCIYVTSRNYDMAVGARERYDICSNSFTASSTQTGLRLIGILLSSSGRRF